MIAVHSKTFDFKRTMEILLFAGVIFVAYFGLNQAYGFMQGQEIFSNDALISGAIGVCEELFFGVFLIGVSINLLHLPPLVAIFGTSGIHAFYHVPNLGFNPMMLALFFACFVVARTIYVFILPKAGVILTAHGVWNFAVAGGQIVIPKLEDFYAFLKALI